MKTLISSISIAAVILLSGCASVTDANLETAEPAINQVTTTHSNDTWDSSSGDDMDPIIDGPEMGE